MTNPAKNFLAFVEFAHFVSVVGFVFSVGFLVVALLTLQTDRGLACLLGGGNLLMWTLMRWGSGAIRKSDWAKRRRE